jgi:carboxymethylenebutenolidase
VALALDLYSAGGKVRCLQATFRSLLSGRGDALADIEAGRAHLAARDECTGKVGVIGFCMGGGFALLVASRGFDASSVNYGMIGKDLDASLRGACPVIGSYGGKDKQLAGEVPRLEDALTRLGVPHDLKVYPTAGHSFLNDAPNGPRLMRPFAKLAHVGPDPEAARDAWVRIEAFFGEHLAP